MPEVVLYALTTCPWCRKAKRFLTDNEVPYSCIDYDETDSETQEKIRGEMDAAQASGFPFAIIGGVIVQGFNPARYRELLGL